MLDEPLDLVRRRHRFDAVRDASRRRAALPYLHVFRVTRDFQRVPHHLVRHRRREQQRLAACRRRERRDDATDVGPEPHVHHAIRLVEHEQLDAAQVGVLLPHVVHQPARRGDDDVDTGLERTLLHAHVDTAVDGGARHPRVIRQAVDFVLDLHRELTRRREYENPGLRCRRGACLDDVCGRLRLQARHSGCPARAEARRRRQEFLQCRHHEGRRLAGAGLGAGEEVGSSNCQRNHSGLDRPGFDESQVANAFEQPAIETERRERDRARVAQ